MKKTEQKKTFVYKVTRAYSWLDKKLNDSGVRWYIRLAVTFFSIAVAVADDHHPIVAAIFVILAGLSTTLGMFSPYIKMSLRTLRKNWNKDPESVCS